MPGAAPVNPAAVGQQSGRVSARESALYSAGTILDQAGLHAVNFLAYPFFNVLLGLSPSWIGAAMAVFRVWDAVADAVVGNWSDNLQSKWGRRRPFMLVGAIGSSLLFALIWFASPAWSKAEILLYFIGLNLLYFCFFAAYSIPYQALAYELTPDFHERTRILTRRNLVGAGSWMIIFGLYPLAELPMLGGPLHGVRTVAVAASIVFLGSGLIPALCLRERFKRESQPAAPLSFGAGLKATLRNRAFISLEGAAILFVVGSALVSNLSFYINTYYVYGGSTRAAASVLMWNGFACVLGILASVPFVPRISRKYGKRNTAILYLAASMLCHLSLWFTVSPTLPYLQVIPMGFDFGFGMGFWTLYPSMIADICDQDELQTGRRREGAYTAAGQWLNKGGYSLALLFSGFLLVWTGFDRDLGHRQEPSVLTSMRVCFVLVPVITKLGAIYALKRYALEEERVAEIRRQLEARRAARG